MGSPHTADRAIDGDTTSAASKWVDLNFGLHNRSTLLLYLHEPALVVAYELFTANDVPRRDPISWTLERRSRFDRSWHLVDSQVNVFPPAKRFASYGLLRLPEFANGPPSPPESAEGDAALADADNPW